MNLFFKRQKIYKLSLFSILVSLCSYSQEQPKDSVKSIEEVLYPAMESGVLDIIIGKGPSARTIQLDLPPFTLVAATTRISLLSSPLRSRFSGGVHRLEMYNQDEMEQIVKRSSRILGAEASEGAVKEIARRSRSTPRTANYFLKRCRDYAQVHKSELSDDSVSKALQLLGVDELGLFETDRNLLRILIEKFDGGPVGLKTLAAATGDEESTIEDVVEPYLIQLGFIERTARGRTATEKGYEHLGIKNKELYS
jgi:Holliday junction DNA helicase RuvB